MKIFIFCMIFVTSGASAQDMVVKDNSLKRLEILHHLSSPALFNSRSYLNIVEPDFFLHKESFFCRQERKFENITKVPLRFRLGSLQSCNWLEGKPNAIKND